MEDDRSFSQMLKEDYNMGLLDFIEDSIRRWIHSVIDGHEPNEEELISALLMLRDEGVLFFDMNTERDWSNYEEEYWLLPDKNHHVPFYGSYDDIYAKIGIREDIKGEDGLPFFSNIQDKEEILYFHREAPCLNRERDGMKTFCLFINLSRFTVNNAFALNRDYAIESNFILKEVCDRFFSEYLENFRPIQAMKFDESIVSYSYPLYFGRKNSLLTVSRLFSIIGEFNGNLISEETQAFLKEHFPYNEDELESMEKPLTIFYGITEVEQSSEENYILVEERESNNNYPTSSVIEEAADINDPLSRKLAEVHYLTTNVNYPFKILSKGKKYEGKKAHKDFEGICTISAIDDNGKRDTLSHEPFEYSYYDNALISALYSAKREVYSGYDEIPLSAIYKIMVRDKNAVLSEKERERLKERLRLLNTRWADINTKEIEAFKDTGLERMEGTIVSVSFSERRVNRQAEGTETFVHINDIPLFGQFAEKYKGGLISACHRVNEALPCSVSKVDGYAALRIYMNQLRFQYLKLKPKEYRSHHVAELVGIMGIDYNSLDRKEKTRKRDYIFRVFSEFFEKDLFGLTWEKDKSSRAITKMRITKLSK